MHGGERYGEIKITGGKHLFLDHQGTVKPRLVLHVISNRSELERSQNVKATYNDNFSATTIYSNFIP